MPEMGDAAQSPGVVCLHTTQTAPPNSRPTLEVADVLRLYGTQYCERHPLPPHEAKVLRLIEICRTAALGGHLERCDVCGYEAPRYNSCRDRHCPKCQSLNKERWLGERKEELLPVSYFHLVFTLPHELNLLVLANKRLLLSMLFGSASEVLQRFAHDPRWHLEGKLGWVAVLHTWSQTLIDHFHLHCLIPAGVIQQDGGWKPARETFLFRTRSLAKAFRREFLDRLEQARLRAALLFPKGLVSLEDAKAWNRLIGSLRGKAWIVYAKRPFCGAEQVLEYLGRYTHRVALSNHRIRSVSDGFVTFSYKDRADHDRTKLMKLEAGEFIRRFLLHILPAAFMKIRYFGFLANCHKGENLDSIRAQLGASGSPADGSQRTEETVEEMMMRLTGRDISVCPRCGIGRLVLTALPPEDPRVTGRLGREAFDSS